MLQESNRWFVLCLTLVLAACGSEGSGDGNVDDATGTTEDVGAENTDTTNVDTGADDESENDTGTSDAGTQTDDESTDTNDAGTQTDDESTDTNDAGTQTDDESTDTDTTDDTDTDDSTDTGSDTDDEAGYDLNDKWEGSYTCSQGFTRLTLQMVHDTGNNSLEAVFAFYADNSNPDVPTGRYTMTGSFNPSNNGVDLNEGEWIEQPSGYVMVSLDGTLTADGATISGTVDDFSCTEFTVVRGN